jgi:hypothetical protein
MEKRNRNPPKYFSEFFFPGKKKYLYLKQNEKKKFSKKISNLDNENSPKKNDLTLKEEKKLIDYSLSENQIKNFFDMTEFDKKIKKIIKEREKKEKRSKKNTY